MNPTVLIAAGMMQATSMSAQPERRASERLTVWRGGHTVQLDRVDPLNPGASRMYALSRGLTKSIPGEADQFRKNQMGNIYERKAKVY